MKSVWVLLQNAKSAPELLGCAQTLNDDVAALVIGDQALAETAIKFGASQAYLLGETSDTRLFEDYLETVAALVQEHQPELVLMQANKRGRLMAGRLSAILGTATLADVKKFLPEGNLTVQHMLYGGGAVRTESAAATAVATIPAGSFDPAKEGTSRTGEIIQVEFITPAHTVKCVERRQKPPSSVDLTAATRVVGIGRGMKQQEDIALVEALAQKMGAEIACSRPIAEGVVWLPRERYLGVSGNVIKPDIYLALGISGQVQHMVGVNEAKLIVAVNTDKNAPIFSQADYGIVGDLYKVIPLLQAEIEKLS